MPPADKHFYIPRSSTLTGHVTKSSTLIGFQFAAQLPLPAGSGTMLSPSHIRVFSGSFCFSLTRSTFRGFPSTMAFFISALMILLLSVVTYVKSECRSRYILENTQLCYCVNKDNLVCEVGKECDVAFADLTLSVKIFQIKGGLTCHRVREILKRKAEQGQVQQYILHDSVCSPILDSTRC